MKFTSVFTAVLALHLVVIAALLFQPGCSTTQKERSPRHSEVLSEGRSDYATTAHGEHSPGIHADFNTGVAPAPLPGQEPRPALQPPSRPTWTLFEESETVVAAPVEPAPREVLQPLRPQEPALAAYTVQRGDSLWKISRDHGVSLDALLAANDLSRDSVLRVGQRLRIPGESAALPTAPVAEATRTTPSTVDTATTAHTVRSGDTLSGLARQYGTTVQAIQAANGLRNSTIRVGQELVIPAAGTAVAPTTAAPSAPAAAPRVPSGPSQTYTVKSGDTLDAISRQFGVSVADLMRDNSIADARRLRVGQELRIRGTAPAAPPTPAPAATPRAPAAPAAPAPAPAPSPQAPVFEEVEVETVTLDPLDMLDDVPVIEAEESN